VNGVKSLEAPKTIHLPAHFLQKLVEEDALINEGTKGEPPNESKTYRLDKKNLEKAIYNDPFWNWIRDISIKMINRQEPYKKVVTDI